MGHVIGEVGSLPDVYVELNVNFLLERLGVNTTGEDQHSRVSQLTKQEVLMLNIGSMTAGARVMAVLRRTATATLQLVNP
ncbi:eukaryotic translation initiation factor 2 subunit gamma, partial [Tanacetum coccineum]